MLLSDSFTEPVIYLWARLRKIAYAIIDSRQALKGC